LDEPTAGLDRAGVDRLISVIREEIARGAGVVVVSHEPRVFAEIADDHIVMERGRIV
jgi:heme exporter protein A